MANISPRTECMRSEGLRIRKVSAKRHPVLPGIANISPRTECMRNQGCRIYKITGKITESTAGLPGITNTEWQVRGGRFAGATSGIST